MPQRPVHTGIHQWGPRFVVAPSPHGRAGPTDRLCEVCGFAESFIRIGDHSCSGIRNILGRPIQDFQDPTEGDQEQTTVEARGCPDHDPVSVSSAGLGGVGRASGALLTGQRQDGPIQVPAQRQHPDAGSRPVSGFKRRRGISPASPAQRLKARELACIVCGKDRFEATVDPAHLVPRSLLTEGQDDPLAVVPLCRLHHDLFDRASLDLLPYLEPAYADEIADAVRRFGILPTLRQVTGQRWVPVESVA